MIATSSTPESPLWILAGVVIGGVLTFIGTWWNDKLRRLGERQYIATALSSELHSFFKQVDRVGLIRRLEEDIAESERRQRPFHHNYPLAESYSEVLANNLDRIGSLPISLARDTLEIYGLLKGWAEDVKTMESGIVCGKPPDIPPMPLGEALKFLRSATANVKEAKQKAESLIPRLEAEARRDVWKDCFK
jgi:hypothetical protein